MTDRNHIVDDWLKSLVRGRFAKRQSTANKTGAQPASSRETLALESLKPTVMIETLARQLGTSRDERKPR